MTHSILQVEKTKKNIMYVHISLKCNALNICGGFGRIGIGRIIPVLGLSHLEHNFSGSKYSMFWYNTHRT